MQVEKFNKRAQKSVVDIAWAVWNRLGLYGSGGSNRYSTDIEAAVVLAAFAGWLDLRLLDCVLSWLTRYHDILNGERLKILLKDISDPFAARCVGAMIETAAVSANSKRMDPFLKYLKNNLPLRSDKSAIFTQSRSPGSWVERDKIFQKWGLAKENTVLTDKLQNDEWVVRTNLIMQCRYLFGISARADIIYALQVLLNEGRVIEISTLSSYLGYNHSSVFRVMKDLERGGYIEFSGGKRLQKAMWRPPLILTLDASDSGDKGLINWKAITGVLIQLLYLLASISEIKNEIIVKHKLYEFHNDVLPVIKASGLKRMSPQLVRQVDSLSLQNIFDQILGTLSYLLNTIIDPKE